LRDRINSENKKAPEAKSDAFGTFLLDPSEKPTS
jgi:hypothetical protein